MMVNDLRDELLRTKKAYAIVVGDNHMLRSRLRVLERDFKQKCREIDHLTEDFHLDHGNGDIMTNEKIQLGLMKQRVNYYKRLIREKNEENQLLLGSQNTIKNFETRKIISALESECERLRFHLEKSIPESEHLKEKSQFLALINKLMRENAKIKKLIGEYERRKLESERFLRKIGGTKALVREFRSASLSSRHNANFYRSALRKLLNERWPPVSDGKSAASTSCELEIKSCHKQIPSDAENIRKSRSISSALPKISSDKATFKRFLEKQSVFGVTALSSEKAHKIGEHSENSHQRMYQTTSSSERTNTNEAVKTTPIRKDLDRDLTQLKIDNKQCSEFVVNNDDLFFEDKLSSNMQEISFTNNKSMETEKESNTASQDFSEDLLNNLVEEPTKEQYCSIKRILKSHRTRQQMINVRLEVLDFYNQPYQQSS